MTSINDCPPYRFSSKNGRKESIYVSFSPKTPLDRVCKTLVIKTRFRRADSVTGASTGRILNESGETIAGQINRSSMNPPTSCVT